ncbi:hypothetical protein [Achromobacter phage Motura]|uniref:Uncharacterized protein n=1 Tax=Achromobacter phage Motura TaxID=2591403 RepID=A0A514CT56_9CAUD|nr:hypothetical protein H1O15_gp098 [Achromobacter phage Motura]QDH83652.1 hypothetical protein [Achromobacter phage Motura]
MTFNLQHWMDDKVEWHDGISDRETSKLSYLCFLNYASGGSEDPDDWGPVRMERGHQRGLTKWQGVRLLTYIGYLDGLEDAGVNVDAVWNEVKAYSARQEWVESQDGECNV